MQYIPVYISVRAAKPQGVVDGPKAVDPKPPIKAAGLGGMLAVSGSVGRGLLGVLSRGLERVHQQIWQQPVASGGTGLSASRGGASGQSLTEDDETGGNFEFLQALARRKQAGGGQ